MASFEGIVDEPFACTDEGCRSLADARAYLAHVSWRTKFTVKFLLIIT